MNAASGRSPPLLGVYETVLYGPDLPALTSFYTELLGLRRIEAGMERLLSACRLPDGGVLLLFDPAVSGAPGREVPEHGAAGPGHIAFRVSGDDLARWREYLERHGVEIERAVRWSQGVESIYVRDPAGNSVEFAVGELWD
jgi:catechol 2,3-dioxygenase-like lactoylglutathione lyase family enzyme